MASADATNGPAVVALESRTVTPIAQLDPELPDQNSRSVRGEVTITWPYNRVTHTLAFLLAEPDVRLRRTKGQVRVQLHGPSAKAIADCGLGACDEVLLGLDGVEWTKDESPGRIPGARVDWQLQFTQKLVLQVKLNGSDEPKHISVDSTQTELPNELPEPSAIQQLEKTVAEPEPAVIDNISAIRQIPDIALNEYPSPAFIKRARISYGALFEEDGQDIFEEDGGIKGKGRKRSRFASRKSNGWRYSSKSPSPEPEPASEEDQVSQSRSPDHDAMEDDTTAKAPSPKPKMTDGASQTVESEMTPMPPTASEQSPTEKPEAVSHPSTWGTANVANKETPRDTALQETEVAEAASHILGMANGTIHQSYPYQHTDNQAHPAANPLFGSSKPAVSGLSMFGTPANVPIQSNYGIADQVRFGFSHTPQVPHQTGSAQQMHSVPESGSYPDSYLDHSVPVKYEGMESYVNIAQSNPELQHGQDYSLVPGPTGTESFERGQWEMATQAPQYNPIEGGHFGADALAEGIPATIEDPSLHADPTRPDQVPEGFRSYGAGTEGPVGFEEPQEQAESEQDTEGPEVEELVENEEVNEAAGDDIGVDDEVEYNEYGEEVEEGDYDQREYLEPETDDEGLSQDDDEVELEVAERYGEGDVYDEDEDEDEEMDDWDGERSQYDDEDASESEDKDLGQRFPSRAPAAAASADPVVISLLSDSEDEDEAPPPRQLTPPTNRPAMTRQLSIRHSSPLKPAGASPHQKDQSSSPAEKDQPAGKEEPVTEQPVVKDEPTESPSKSSPGHLDKAPSADQMDHDHKPKEDTIPSESAMTIVHTNPATGTEAEVVPSSSLADVKDNASETGSLAQSTPPAQTLATESEAQVEKHESDSKAGEDAPPKTEDGHLEEQEEDHDESESEANDETFEGFSSDASIVERPEVESESEEDDDEMLDEDQEEHSEIVEEDEGDGNEEHDDSQQQVVDLLDTTSEEGDDEEDEEEEEEQRDDDDTFEPVESESEEDVHVELDREDKEVVDKEVMEVAEEDDTEEVVLEVEEQKKVEVEQEVEEKVQEEKAGADKDLNEKALAIGTTDVVEEVKETDKEVSEVKGAEDDAQEVKYEKGDVEKTAEATETADEPKEEKTQSDQGEAQGQAKSPVAVEGTVQETVTVEEEERLEANNADTTRETEPEVTLTVTAPSDEEQKASDRVEDVDEMEAIQHQLFDDMARASREASMMEVSDAEHVSVMSQDTPRAVQVDSDEEMGDGDDEDVEMADAATPRPEIHTEAGQVSQAVEVEMTSEAIEVDSDSMSVTHEESAKVEMTEAPPHGQDSAMEDAEMVVEIEEETQVTVEQEVTVTETPAAQQPQASTSSAVDVTGHAPQQAAPPSSSASPRPFASQVPEDEVMLIGSSSPTKEAVREKPHPTSDRNAVHDQEVSESSQLEVTQLADGTVVAESTEVVTEVEVFEETETTAEPQVAATDEGVETQDEVSLIVVEEVSDEQDLKKNRVDEADTDTQPLSVSYYEADESKQATPTKEEATTEAEPSQTTVTPDQSQLGDDKTTGLTVKPLKPVPTPSTKRGRKQQPALEPLRTSARLTRARSGSIPKSVTTEENDHVASQSQAAALASPSKRSFASSVHSFSAAAPEDTPTPQPDDTPANATGPLSNDPAVLKLDLSRRLRSGEPQFANCQSLKAIRNHLGQNVDILAIVASTPTNPTRAKREYMMSFNVTDPSTTPNHVVEVQMYNKHQEQLPVVKPGDAILLKQVEIRSISGAGKGGFGLRTGDASAWAVFEASAEEEKEDGGEEDRSGEGDETRDAATTEVRPPQIKGPAVDNWKGFAGYMVMLKRWYRLLLKDEAAKGKLEKAVRKMNEK